MDKDRRTTFTSNSGAAQRGSKPQTAKFRFASLTTAVVIVAVISLACGGTRGESGGSNTEEAAAGDRVLLELSGLASRGIWGTAADDLFVSGGAGFVVHFDGVDYEVQSLESDFFARVLWGTASDNVYAVAGQEIFRFDGESWQSVYEADAFLLDIWGASAEDIHVVGGDGTALHFDGIEWSPVVTNETMSINRVEGTGSGEVYAIGTFTQARDILLRFDGSRWVRQSVTSARHFRSLAVHASGVAYLGDVTGSLFIGSGNSFGDFLIIDETPVSLAAADRFVLFGADDEGRVFRWAQSAPEWFDFPAPVLETWASPFGNTYAVGQDGQVVLHDGEQWQTVRPARRRVDLRTVFGAPDGTLFALGSEAYVNFDGRWIRNDLANPATRVGGSAVSKDFAVAVGANGSINHWGADGWSATLSPTTADLRDALAFSSRLAFAVGRDGIVLEFDGGRWSEMTTLGGNLNSIDGIAPNDMFACGDLGRIYHYDGEAWELMDTPTNEVLNSIFTVSASNAFAVGRNGVVLQYDGSQWAQLETPDSDNFQSVWADGPRNVFVLSVDGGIFRFDGETFEPFQSPSGGLALDIWGTRDSLVVAGQATTVFRIDL